MLHLAMHTAIVIVLAVTVTVVNNTRATAVGVTMVVKKMEEYWCIFHGEVMNSTAILQDEYWMTRRKKTPVSISISLRPSLPMAKGIHLLVNTEISTTAQQQQQQQ